MKLSNLKIGQKISKYSMISSALTSGSFFGAYRIMEESVKNLFYQDPGRYPSLYSAHDQIAKLGISFEIIAGASILSYLILKLKKDYEIKKMKNFLEDPKNNA